jgi:uncharacterized protein
MKRTVARSLLAVCFFSLPLLALDVPALKGRVNDYANILKPVTVATLEAKLADFEKAESTQIAVLTIPSLEGGEIEDFSIRVAEKWKIGQKKLDNGVILVIAKEDHRMRIEVGYGLEGKLTDLRSGRIIDNIISPSFKAGDFDKGVTDGVDAIMQTVQGEYAAVDSSTPVKKDKDEPWGYAVPGLIAFFFIGIVGKIKRLLGGVAGAVIIPIAGLFILGLKLMVLVLIPVGFVLGLIIPTLMTIIMMMGLFGGRGSGSGGGGSFGGGGFSGGGGSFGGGGASGSW